MLLLSLFILRDPCLALRVGRLTRPWPNRCRARVARVAGTGDRWHEAAVDVAAGAGLAALSTRAQRLRELLTVKEIRNDLTEAEFALTIARSLGDDEGVGKAGGGGGIDFESIVFKLARHQANLEDRR